MTPDQSRLDRSRTAPLGLQIWEALQGLRSPLCFMMSGAHPDDECAPMLAALHFRDGLDLAYVCSTRGEGGQNNLGTERGPVLGALRTAEMEAASARLNMRMYWLSEAPGDQIDDWRLSKSGDETLEVWGHERVLARLVHVIRRARPDMLCPTFLDVPGQHGHHRAMTRAAHEAFEAAADPGFAGCDLPVWEVAKLYLPAWSGAGRAYDDDLPPPPATLTIPGGGQDPVSGWPYALIGAQSHGAHRSQGMGYWPDGARDFPLHLARSRVGQTEAQVWDNLPASLADLGLAQVQRLLDEACACHADPVALRRLAQEAYLALEGAELPAEHSHRIARKKLQLARILALLSGEIADISPRKIWLRPGESVDAGGGAWVLPEGWRHEAGQVGPEAGVPPEDGYRDTFDPLEPPLPALEVVVDLGAAQARSLWQPDRPLIAAPARSLRLDPPSLLLNLAQGEARASTRIDGQHPAEATLSADLPDGWQAEIEDARLTIRPPAEAAEGHYSLPLRLDAAPAALERRIDYPHIRPTQSVLPAALPVSLMRVALPERPLAYIGAGLDNVPARLKALGAGVRDLSQGARLAELGPQDTLLIGIHAFGFNADLAAARPALHRWVRAGGRLVTLYHRPWDNWSADETPPLPLEIGQPSLRWRVTHRDAPVRILAPDHPVLQGPNKITEADFEGWHKERGLYFAQSWDAAYRPLLAMSDPGETPLEGGLLVAEIGAGRHIHSALNLHHQLDRGVPGAARLLANLLS